MTGNLEGSLPLSYHMRYALVRNQVMQNGEHKKKLEAISRDHRRKADDILNGRSQALRDHVITSYNATRQHPTHKKIITKMTLSTNPEAMEKIKELSTLYLLRSNNKTSHFNYTIPRTPGHQNYKIHQTSVKENRKFLAQRPVNWKNAATLALANSKNTNERSETEDDQKPKNENDQSLTLPSLSFLPVYRNAQLQQQQKFARKWKNVNIHSQNMPARRLVPVSEPERPHTTSSFQIRRRSCRFSINAKSLIHLQQMQQLSRTKSAKPISSFQSRQEKQFGNKRFPFVSSGSVATPRIPFSYRSLEENKNNESTSEFLQSRQNETLNKEIKKTDSELETTQSQKLVENRSHSGSKWNVVTTNGFKENNQMDPSPVRSDKAIVRKSNLAKSCLTTKDRVEIRVSRPRKLSVTWSESVPPDKIS